MVVLGLAVYLPGLFSIPPIDRDESRFAQASRQMVESGDYVVPKVQDRPRLNKPPLIYWLQCASVAAFGDPPAGSGPDTAARRDLGNIWVFRVPSVLCAVVAMIATWWVGRRMFDPRAAWLAGALLGLCPMVAWDAHQARADQLLLACTTFAQGLLFIAWRYTTRPGIARRGAFVPVAFWAAVGLGIMAKGPITPLVAGLTILALCLTTSRWRWVLSLRPLLGCVIVGAIVGPWVIAAARQVGWDNYGQTIYNETIGRSTEAAEGHWGPPGYHLVLLTVLMFPGSLVTALAVRRAWVRAFGTAARAPGESRLGRLRRARPNPGLFLLCWTIPSWIVFEAVTTKLPHYTMPLYPALCLLSARAAFAGEAGRLAGTREWLSRAGFWIWSILAVPLAVITCLRAGAAARRDRFVEALGLGLAGAAVTMMVLFEWVLPIRMDGSVRIAEARKRIDPALQRPLASVGYHEDSLVFLTRGQLHKIDEPNLRAWAETHPAGLVVLDPQREFRPEQGASGTELRESIDQGAAARGLAVIDDPLAQIGSIWNYSNGRRYDLMFFEPAIAPDASGRESP